MIMKKKKKPEIRFEGFTDDWEQRKLGDVFKEYSEKNHTELPALTIIQGRGTVKREDSARNLMYDESNLSNYKMVRKDDFIVHLRSFEGGLEKSSLDGIVSPAYHTFHSDVADSRFYYLYFRSHEFIKHKLVPHVYGIRDGRSIDIDGMKTIEIPYTSMEEQRKIGDYLESLDHLITLHQRKYEKLKNVKKSMLEKMFPQKGCKVPEIRFFGFTDDWEQRKLDEICDFEKGKGLSKEDISDNGKYPCILYGQLFTEYGMFINNIFSKSNTRNAECKLSEKGDILIPRCDTTPDGLGRASALSVNNVILGFDINILKIKNKKDYNFNYISVALNFHKKDLLSKVVGSTVRHLENKELKDILIESPCAIEEQKKIASLFQCIENLITLHQRELEKLKNIKKALLEKMF